MFEMLHALGLSNIIRAPISGTDLVLIGFAYVDDSDLLSYSIDGDGYATASKMQQIIDSWEKAAKVTGGAIAPEKCWWYMVEFEWDKECNWKYVTLNDTHQHEMYVNDHNNTRKKIKYLLPNKANEMLGVYISPDGNNDEQLENMIAKASKAAEIIRTTSVSPHEAWLGLTTMTMKSLEYGLPATTLSEDDCKKIMRPLLNSFLPKAHINRNIKQDVLYADVQSQGLGLHSLYLSQGIRHVIEIIEHIWKDSTTGQFINTSLEYLRLEIGINENLLNCDYNKYAFLIISPTWITNTWQFMAKFNITLTVNPTTFQPAREQDIPIMQHLIDIKQFTAKELIIVNKCRIYLQAFMLSDIVTGNGKSISFNAWNGIKETNSRHKIVKWPRMPNPSTNMWNTWRSILHRSLCSVNKNFLDKSLRKWYGLPNNWPYYINSETLQLYYKDDNSKFYNHKIVSATRRTTLYHPHRIPVETPNVSSLLPTTVYLRNNQLRTEGTTLFSTDTLPIITTPYNHHQPWLFPRVDKKNDLHLIQAIYDGTAIAASDGSYYESHQYATAAWCLTDSKYNILTDGNSIVPGIGNIHNSYRSELVGMLAILTYIDELNLDTSNPTTGIHIIGDNERALQVLDTWSMDKMTPNHKHADIISSLLKLRDKLSLTITTEHVHSHQDDSKPIESLPPAVQLNIQMDRSAKAFALKMINSNKQQFETTTHYASFPTCFFNNKPIPAELFNSLYHLISIEKMENYWHSKQRITKELITTVNKPALAKGMKALPTNLRRFTAKWSCEFLATGKNMVQWNLRHDGYCPFCTEPNENTKHILLCSHLDALLGWNEAMDMFTKQLLKIDTCYIVILAIQNELNAWRYDRPPDKLNYPDLLTAAIDNQTTIGWKLFLEGLISNKWQMYMHQYYTKKKSKRKATTWASKLVTYCIKFLYTIWNNRNQQLHKTERINDLEGVPILRQSIQQEWEQGLGRLPASEYSQYFTHPLELILSKPLEWQQNWFLIIRQARILIDNDNLIHDQFATSSVLQKWAGLSYTITDDEALPYLQEAIGKELCIGIAKLPHIPFFTYFQLPLTNLIQQSSINQLKLWLKSVRNGRQRFDNDNLSHNDFQKPGLLRDWLGL